MSAAAEPWRSDSCAEEPARRCTSGSDKRLLFFEKDVIDWREHELGELYRRLFALKKAHPALWNGAWGAPMTRVPNSHEQRWLTFVRTHAEGDRVLAAFNFSPEAGTATLGQGPYTGSWRDAFTGEPVPLEQGASLTLPAWGHRVLVGE